MIKLKLMGRELHLYFSAAASFALDALEDAWNAGHLEGSTLSEILGGTGAESGEALAQAAGILSEAGAAAREYIGLPRGDAMNGDDVARMLPLLTPKDLLELRRAVTEALAEGYRAGGEEAAEQEVDLGLLEIERRERAEEKKTFPGAAASAGRDGRRFGAGRACRTDARGNRGNVPAGVPGAGRQPVTEAERSAKSERKK